MIDIFDIQPHVVSRDLCGYTVLLYGQPKTGKTTTAASFPDALLLGFETGWLTLPGVKAMPVNKWSEFKMVIKQLKKESEEAANEGRDLRYKNIIVDTVDIAYDLCEKYICSMNGVDKINEIPYGGGYTQAKREFDETLRTMPQLGYGLVLISHAQDKTFTDENGAEYNQIVPTLGNGPRLVVDRMADIIGYAHPMQEADGSTHTTLFMRGTPRFLAGSRFAYTPNSIDFNYQNLVDAIGDAIDKQAAEFDNQFVMDSRTQDHEVKEGPSFDELMAEFNKMVGLIQEAVGSSFGAVWAPRITEIVERNLGKGHKVNEMTRDQKEHLELIVDDLKEAVANGL